jgi:hypothetical protein
MNLVLVRGSLLAFAVAAVAWLGFSLWVVDLQSSAEGLADRSRQGPVPENEVRSARENLRRAGRYTVGTEALLTEGLLLLGLERRTEAAAVADKAVDEEPENFQGWLLAYYSATDRTRSDWARRRIVRLNFWAADQLR